MGKEKLLENPKELAVEKEVAHLVQVPAANPELVQKAELQVDLKGIRKKNTKKPLNQKKLKIKKKKHQKKHLKNMLHLNLQRQLQSQKLNPLWDQEETEKEKQAPALVQAPLEGNPIAINNLDKKN